MPIALMDENSAVLGGAREISLDDVCRICSVCVLLCMHAASTLFYVQHSMDCFNVIRTVRYTEMDEVK